VFAGAPRTAELEAPDVREVPLPMRVAMALLAGAVVVLGLQPQWLDPLLRALPGV
jgi:formate hydrogenlyase subunit 3/multisubunit Na+/H+ antiporter MnhD subunit